MSHPRTSKGEARESGEVAAREKLLKKAEAWPLEAYGTNLDDVRAALSSKTWFGFDLDDTLHEFRKASSHASLSVFQVIHYENPNVGIEDLEATYRDILRSKTAGAFADGRTSIEYRRERFSYLLQAYGFTPSQDMLDRLLTIYQNNLRNSLRLKAGALQLLQRLKTLGKKVIVVTEGPRDAQEWTVAELGLQSYIDILITTNEIGKSKVDGLFSIVLRKYSIAASDIVYVGDNEQRDIIPAREAGIMTLFYDERSDCRFDDHQALRLNSLSTLKHIID